MTENSKKSTDVIFNYDAQQYSAIDNYFHNNGMDSVKIQSTLALRGIDIGNRIPLKTNDGNGERQLSRTVYDRNSVDFDNIMGLLTILDNLDKPYDEVMNHMAFEINKNDKSYTDLVNVSTFYEYMLGGIESCYNDIAEYNINDEKDVFDAMVEYFEDNEDLINKME